MSTPVRSRLARPGPRRRFRRIVHRLRAFRHHALAVLREFRVPIWSLVIVTLGGGFLYGELYELARGERIPLIDRPYVMVQLMILEAPETVPPEWYLVIFWYLLPLVFVILLGLGAADFVDLFFNRDEDRDAWGEALAMTYRSHAIVFGAGHVGLRVVRDLADMDTEVVVIDHEPSPTARETLDTLGVPVVRGDGRQPSTLEKAGIRDAESFVACTGNDQVNIESVMKARHANPEVRIVVRLWDRSLGEQMERFLDVQHVLSAADLSAPAFAGAALGVEITQTLEVCGAEHSTIRLTVRPGSFLAGTTVGALEKGEGLEVVLLARDGRPDLDPEPDARVEAGDDLVIFAEHGTILGVVARNQRASR